MTHSLRSRGLRKAYKGKVAVDGVSIDLNSGEIVGLLGPNGAGKTTTFYLIVGMIKADEGRIFIDDHDISGLPMYRRARMGISYLPQEPSIFRGLSVRDNLRVTLEITARNGASVDDEIERLLEEFQLGEFAERKGVHLSGGERRRTEIARTIATNPRFLLFDEPFSGIDPIAILELKNTLRYLKSKGLGILLTDHNVRETLSVTDRAYIISEGVILEEGAPERLVDNPRVRDAYLGEEFSL